MRASLLFSLVCLCHIVYASEPACFQIGENNSIASTPAVSNSWIVWIDIRNTPMGEVYGYDLAAGKEYCLASGAWEHKAPDISGSVITWQDSRNGTADIYRRGIFDSNQLVVAAAALDSADPAIDGNNIVWQADPTGRGDIYLYNIKTGIRKTICSASGIQAKPAIRGNIVVWQDNRSSSSMDIYAYDLVAGTEMPICVSSAWKQNPATNGTVIVWQDKRSGDDHIYAYNVNTHTEFPICTHAGNQLYPAISGNIVIWQDDRNGDSDIYGYDLVKQTEFPICTDSSSQQNPAISGNVAVWTDYRNGLARIYGALLPQVASLKIVSPNGGEQIKTPGTYNIKWQTAGGFVSKVKLEFSSNSGAGWTVIDANAPNTGSYQWPCPEADSTNCLIRITDKNDSLTFDASDNVFTVFPCTASLTADLNGDCIVNFKDFAQLAQQWLINGRSH